MVPRSERVWPETSSLWAPLHEQLWKLQMLLSERVRLDAWRLLHQWVTSSSKEQEAIEAVHWLAFNLFRVWTDVFRLQDLLSRSLPVWLWGGPGGDPMPLPVSRAAARRGRKNLCRWGTLCGAFLLIFPSSDFHSGSERRRYFDFSPLP